MWSQFFFGSKLNNIFYCRLLSLILPPSTLILPPANRKPFFFRPERATNRKINTELNGYRLTYLEFCQFSPCELMLFNKPVSCGDRKSKFGLVFFLFKIINVLTFSDHYFVYMCSSGAMARKKLWFVLPLSNYNSTKECTLLNSNRGVRSEPNQFWLFDGMNFETRFTNFGFLTLFCIVLTVCLNEFPNSQNFHSIVLCLANLD